MRFDLSHVMGPVPYDDANYRGAFHYGESGTQKISNVQI